MEENYKIYQWERSFDQGSLRLEKAYMGLHNVVPNKLIVKLGDAKIDVNTLDLESIKNLFPGCSTQKTFIIDNRKTSTQDECPSPILDDDEDDDVYVDGKWQNTTLTIFASDQQLMIQIDSDTIIVLYNDCDPVECYKKIVGICPKKDTGPKEATINLVAYSNDYYTISSKIRKTDINLKENYNDDFLPVFEDITDFLKQRKSGLIILRGEKGTGKTSLIRHLISQYPHKYILVTNSVADHLASPEFISFMLEHRDSIFILEDCEQLLAKRTDGFGSNGAISTILNMSDGLMSDIFNVKFICTFNADIGKIDDALLRKGRCYANYEFEPLCEEKTKVLLNRQGVELDEYKPMTLANIYNYKDSDCDDQPKITNTIGF